MRYVLPLLAISLLDCCATPPAATSTSAAAPAPPPCRQTIVTSVPVIFDDSGTPVVIAAIGTTPAALAVDTGAEGTVISRQLARQVGLTGFFKELNYPFMHLNGFGPSVDVFYEPAPPITLGNAQASDMSIFVLTKPTSPEVFGTQSAVDGLMGNDIWTWHNVYLDFPDGKLMLFDQQSCLGPPASWVGRIGKAHFSMYRGYIILPVTVDGHAVQAILDTGTGVSTLPAPLMNAAGLKPDDAAPVRTIRMEATGGPVPAQLYRFKNITIGNDLFLNPIFAVPHTGILDYQAQQWMSPVNPSKPIDPYWNIIIGEDFIRHHRMFISYATHTLYIQN